MSKIIFAVVVSGTGVLGVGGYYSYRAIKGERTLLSKLESSLQKHQKILSAGDVEWSSWSEVYKVSTKNKIPEVTHSNLSKWCETTLKGSDESKLDLASRWCVINTRSLSEEIKSTSSASLLPLDGDNTSAWEGAWESYNKSKGTSGLEIDDTTFKASNSDKTKGGPALKKWCSDLLSKKMYELLELKAREKAEKWCFSSSS
ncbi:hypothetical protein MHC_03075 [Mycoplasma haemocanis str. Illinois]|uniref:Uncharacterized protein n=1 Tax=Mycoplasma haemocanis (strain Illinois) TaxID=1111676 RepID=H6N753_MYCHN|nr:hypothetical protein [Mycoplasma haemocanis]AEW45475.1 hypothetical protein MHC_03075 [Mycoplasma haemocanis str. Illinois]